ncbi:hypothetical protein GCM10010232_68070 [Streptomyces amakusaensis]|uniref:Uncharacterized protein n=1 Tax=Streptomyces amakusaensis TaxID=67271 RepID=A0ABW0ASM2_9ACTN
MDDPAPSSGSSELVGPGAPGFGPVLGTMDLVITYYNSRIQAEQRSATPDPERLEDLMAQRRACVEDKKRLGEAGPEELARLGTLYAARLRELDESGQLS